jgi:long-subunit fatty acid transport protein
MGISIGVPFSSFEESKVYTEDDPDDEIAVFNSLEYTELLNTSGVGFNFKAGFTYKITPAIRFGGAFHSPTWNRFTDNYSTSMTYDFNDGFNPVQPPYNSLDGTFQYRITTPWRAIGSVGTIYRIGEIVGFVNADFEHLDYTNASYNGTAFDKSADEQRYTNEVNRNVRERLGTATNVRLGTEMGYKNLRLRVGYSWEQSAFNADDFYNNKVSFGAGFRGDRFFIDLGIRLSEQTEGYNPYVVIDQNLDPLSNISTNRTRGALTLGFKF